MPVVVRILDSAQYDRLRGDMIATLVCHPDTPPRSVRHVSAAIWLSPDDVRLRYSVETGVPHDLFIPELSAPERADGLWTSTCFEMFIRDDGDAYFEYNFSPGTQWAAYRFPAYRKGRTEHVIARPPSITVSVTNDALVLSVTLARSTLKDAPGGLVALSAVIAERDGTKSYWALRHPPGPPDFHHPDCFAPVVPAAH